MSESPNAKRQKKGEQEKPPAEPPEGSGEGENVAWGVAVHNKMVYIGRMDATNKVFYQLNLDTKELVPGTLFIPNAKAFIFVGATKESLLFFINENGNYLDTAAHILMLPEDTPVAHPNCEHNTAAKVVGASMDPPGILLAPLEAKKSIFTQKYQGQVLVELHDVGQIRKVVDDKEPAVKMDMHTRVLQLATEQLPHTGPRPWKIGPGTARCFREGPSWLKISTDQKKAKEAIQAFATACPKLMKRLATGDGTFPKSMDPEVQECVDFVALHVIGRVGRSVVHSEAERWADDEGITANNPLTEMALSAILLQGGFNHMVPKVALDEEIKRRKGEVQTGKAPPPPTATKGGKPGGKRG